MQAIDSHHSGVRVSAAMELAAAARVMIGRCTASRGLCKCTLYLKALSGECDWPAKVISQACHSGVTDQ
jgi:hypothetical protein